MEGGGGVSGGREGVGCGFVAYGGGGCLWYTYAHLWYICISVLVRIKKTTAIRFKMRVMDRGLRMQQQQHNHKQQRHREQQQQQ